MHYRPVPAAGALLPCVAPYPARTCAGELSHTTTAESAGCTHFTYPCWNPSPPERLLRALTRIWTVEASCGRILVRACRPPSAFSGTKAGTGSLTTPAGRCTSTVQCSTGQLPIIPYRLVDRYEN
ncbi:hypothetical protein AUP68_04946 [Ilyonectria robusta]